MILRSLYPKTNHFHAIPSRSQPVSLENLGIRRYPPFVALSATELGCPRHEAPSDDSVGRGLLQPSRLTRTMIPNPKNEVNQNPSCY